MPTNPNCAVVSRFIEEGINLGKIDSIAQFVWEDVVEQVPFPGQGPGLEGLKDVLRSMRSAFPDLHFSVEEQIAEGGKVLSRFEWTGRYRSDFLGVPATGRSVKVFRDGAGSSSGRQNQRHAHHHGHIRAHDATRRVYTKRLIELQRVTASLHRKRLAHDSFGECELWLRGVFD
jgi:steroid delta-isomerase-like uncharacterized protein